MPLSVMLSCLSESLFLRANARMFLPALAGIFERKLFSNPFSVSVLDLEYSKGRGSRPQSNPVSSNLFSSVASGPISTPAPNKKKQQNLVFW